MIIKIEAKGFDEAFKRLATLPDKLEKKVITGANRAGAVPFKQAVVAEAPTRGGASLRSHESRTNLLRAPGFLKRQVKIKKIRASKSQGSISHVVHKGKAFYGRFVVQGRRGLGGQSSQNNYVARAFRSSSSAAEAAWRRKFLLGFNKAVRELNTDG